MRTHTVVFALMLTGMVTAISCSRSRQPPPPPSLDAGDIRTIVREEMEKFRQADRDARKAEPIVEKKPEKPAAPPATEPDDHLTRDLRKKFRDRMLDRRREEIDVRKCETLRELINYCVRQLQYGNIHGVWDPTKNEAVLTLGLIGSDEVTDVLLKHLRREQNDHLRCDIIKALLWIKDPRAEPDLVVLLEGDEYIHVRGLCAVALGELGSDTAVPALEKALEDEYYYVRLYAARSLKKLTGKRYEFKGKDD
jgi:hypothetical protein